MVCLPDGKTRMVGMSLLGPHRVQPQHCPERVDVTQRVVGLGVAGVAKTSARRLLQLRPQPLG